MNNNIEKRLQPRMPLNGYTADIIQDGFVYTATVQDASLNGICLYDLPDRFSAVRGDRFTVIVSSFFSSTHYKLTVHSQWKKKDYRTVAIGFNIVNAPATWKKLINTRMPENVLELSEEGAWDQYAGARV